MPNLVNLDMTWPREEDENLLKILKCKKWNKIGMHRSIYPKKIKYFCPPYDETKLFANEIHGMYNETLLSTSETYIELVDVGWTMYVDLFELLESILPDQINYRLRIENSILLLTYSGYFELYWNLYGYYTGFDGYCEDYLESGLATKDFIIKILYIIVSHYCNELFIDKTSRHLGFSCDAIKIFCISNVADVLFEILRKGLNKGVSDRMFLVLVWAASQKPKIVSELGLDYIIDEKRIPPHCIVRENTLLDLRKILDKYYAFLSSLKLGFDDDDE